MKYWLLYDSEKQSNLLVAVKTEEEIKHMSQFFTSGVWFEYDIKNDYLLLNERLYEKKVKFPKTPLPWQGYQEEKESYQWIK